MLNFANKRDITVNRNCYIPVVIVVDVFFCRYSVLREIPNLNGSLPNPSPQEVSENSRKEEVGKKKRSSMPILRMIVFAQESKTTQRTTRRVIVALC